jgi:DNA adenine methylase
MAEAARRIKGRMIISVNDIAQMREVFAGLPMDRVEIRYTLAGNDTKAKPSGELIIRSWE